MSAPTYHRALMGAYRKGLVARESGKRRHDYPYDDKRTYRGAITWSRSFIRAWQNGWDDKDRELAN